MEKNQSLLNEIREIRAGAGTEAELDARLANLRRELIDPAILNYMFHSNMSDEEVLAKCLAYRPIML